MLSRTVTIPSMNCGHCLNTITIELKEMDGVIDVQGDVDAKSVTIIFKPPVEWESISAVLEEIGFAPEQ